MSESGRFTGEAAAGTCILHLISSMGVRIKDVNAPEAPPQIIRAEIPKVGGGAVALGTGYKAEMSKDWAMRYCGGGVNMLATTAPVEFELQDIGDGETNTEEQATGFKCSAHERGRDPTIEASQTTIIAKGFAKAVDWAEVTERKVIRLRLQPNLDSVEWKLNDFAYHAGGLLNFLSFHPSHAQFEREAYRAKYNILQCLGTLIDNHPVTSNDHRGSSVLFDRHRSRLFRRVHN
jgi:hypothetical protein